jgi:hypothetical protein
MSAGQRPSASLLNRRWRRAPQHRPARDLPWLSEPDERRLDLIKITPGNIFLITMIGAAT